MLIVDISVLMSPYVFTILRGVDPSNLAIAAKLYYTIGRDDGAFPALAGFYGIEQSRAEALRLWIYHHPKARWQKHWKVVEPPGDETGATIFNHLRQRCGRLETEEEKITVPIFLEQIWGAIAEEWPILALGSPVPRVWQDIERLFPEQTSKRDLRLFVADPTAEFRKLGIPLVAIAGLDPWLIHVLAPRPTMVEYLSVTQLLSKLKFVAFSIERENPDESID